MKLEHDFTLDIATAHSRLSKKWKNKKWAWSELVARCSQTKRTDETMKEYLKMTREEQSDIKDVGGFVGGYLSGGRRKTDNVMWRSVATLDIDYGTLDVWDDFTTSTPGRNHVIAWFSRFHVMLSQMSMSLFAGRSPRR